MLGKQRMLALAGGRNLAVTPGAVRVPPVEPSR